MAPADSKAAEPRAMPQLEWQSELDESMTALDSRLRHPRRRAGDTGVQPMLPDLGQLNLTSELLDEIAWRVAEQVRRTQPRPAPPPPEPDAMPTGAWITIRLRWPFFRST
jgi:hypothetical protein